MYKYMRSDLVMENACLDSIKRSSGYIEEKKGDMTVCRLKVTTRREEKDYGCSVGNYITLYYPRPKPTFPKDLGKIVGAELRDMIFCNITDGECVLAVGIGNRTMSADALGPLTVDGLIPTRNGEHTKVKRGIRLCAVECGVMGKTGIESLEIVRGVAKEIGAAAVIAIDALAARDTSRLMATVQISDVGISPGAGIGNRRLALNKKTLGIPVIALGIPTVVSASTIVASALRNVGYDELANEAEALFNGTADLFVTPKDCDIQVQMAAASLADGINSAFWE